jgi:hypothetical protein
VSSGVNSCSMSRTKLRGTKKGGKVSLVWNVQDYEKLLDDLDELEAIRAYDAAKKSGETPVPFEKAF